MRFYVQLSCSAVRSCVVLCGVVWCCVLLLCSAVRSCVVFFFPDSPRLFFECPHVTQRTPASHSAGGKGLVPSLAWRSA